MLRIGALFFLIGGVLASKFTVHEFEDVKEACRHKNIVISDIEVPAGQTLEFSGLKQGTNITFVGKVTFGFTIWQGPLIRISGKNITVTGAPGHLIDCDGKRWWDGKGGNGGVKKPKFFFARLTDSSIVNLNVKNTPVHAFSINTCKNLLVSGITIDNTDGDCAHGGHNTDGFDVGCSSNITIKDCIVKNQDDCLAVNSGKDIVFEGNFCSGGHGISIGSVGGRKDNVVERVLLKNNIVADSANGIRVKTILNAVGSVTNVTFEDISLANIRKHGIVIQGNYLNGGPRGEPTGGVPIRGLVLKDVRGVVNPTGTNVLVWVKNASDWTWDADVRGGQKVRPCQGFPDEVGNKC
ncbi:Hypothetical protein NTJ_10381 [Nesidiocoris tenuis]|uniref:endo-polygalacturonase n=1 Tax=Nesidiocoris tenuis TaxID=355587 RepID=A0ABN7B016_9HEMI|nr:Hypothetical protein NTJ_10381 [Nesidiocoris tenuis]